MLIGIYLFGFFKIFNSNIKIFLFKFTAFKFPIINNTLNVRTARSEDDEKHICPLQLETIHNAILLWSNPGEVIYSPFAGIGSEGYQAIVDDRKFKGSELKEEYFDVAVKNLREAEKINNNKHMVLFKDEKPV